MAQEVAGFPPADRPGIQFLEPAKSGETGEGIGCPLQLRQSKLLAGGEGPDVRRLAKDPDLFLRLPEGPENLCQAKKARQITVVDQQRVAEFRGGRLELPRGQQHLPEKSVALDMPRMHLEHGFQRFPGGAEPIPAQKDIGEGEETVRSFGIEADQPSEYLFRHIQLSSPDIPLPELFLQGRTSGLVVCFPFQKDECLIPLAEFRVAFRLHQADVPGLRKTTGGRLQLRNGQLVLALADQALGQVEAGIMSARVH